MRRGPKRKIGDRHPCGKLKRTRKGPSDRKSVYVIAFLDGAGCKIGISNLPKKRLAEIQISNDRDLRLFYKIDLERKNAISVEKEVHRMLRRTISHSRGEWYDIWPKTAVAVIEDVMKKLNIAA